MSAVDPAVAQKPIPIAKISRSKPVDFEKDVLPILRKNCLACHSATEAEGELVLETPALILKGGGSGPVIVPKKGAESLLLKAAAHREEPFMPPDGNEVGAKPLTPQQLGILKAWIDEGATGTVSTSISPSAWRPLPPGINAIYATAITRDGQFVAAGRANQIFIYHAPSGQLVTRLTDPALQEKQPDGRPGVAHLDLVQSLAFNRDGDLLASGGFRTVKLWRRPRDVRRLELKLPDTVTAVTANTDGTMLAAAAADNSIRLWDRATGKAIAVLKGHTATVTALEFLPDGLRLASASLDKTVRLWNISDGRLAGRIDTPTGINDIALTANGARLATAGADNFTGLWTVPDALSQPLDKSAPNADVLAVSPDRRFIASANAEGTVSVVDVDCGQIVDRTWKAHEGAVTGLAFSANGELLASCAADKRVHVWDVLSGEKRATLHGTLAELSAVAFRPDGKQLATGTADGRVTVWNLEAEPPRMLAAVAGGQLQPAVAAPAETAAQKDTDAETEPKELPPPLSPNGVPATAVVVSPDGKLLATSGVANDRPAILVRELATGRLLHTLLGHQDAVTALSFSADNRRLVSGSTDQTVRVWNLADAKFPEAATFAGHGATVTGVSFNSNATQVVSGAANNSVKLWDVATGEELKDFAGHSAAVVGVAMTPNNQLVISAAADKSVRFWNPADGKQLRAITDTAVLAAMTVSRDGTRIAVARADGGINVYKQADGKLIASLTGHTTAVRSFAFSPDGKRLISATAEQAIVWNTDDGRLLEILPVPAKLSAVTYGPAADNVVLATGDSGLWLQRLRFAAALGDMTKPVTALVYSPNGQSVYSSSLDGTIRRFTPANGQQAFNMKHGAPIHDLAISPNGQLLATAGDDKLLKLWNAANGSAAQNPQLAGFTAAVNAVTFSADGTRVIGGGSKSQEVLVFNIVSAAQRFLEQSFVEHAGAVESVICAGGTPPVVVTASADKTVRRWELLAERRLGGHSQPVTAVAVIPGTVPQLVTGSKDGTVRRWNMVTGQQIQQLNHGGPVTDVAARADGQRFASAGENNVAKLWNATNGRQIAEMKGDIRSRTIVSQLTQELNLTTGTLNSTKAALGGAEKDLPVKAAAAKTAAAALTAANTAVAKQQAVFDKTVTVKAAAEKIAVEAAAAAQKAALAKAQADAAAVVAAALAKRAAAKAARAKTAVNADKENPTLAKVATDAVKLSADAAAKAKAAADADTAAAKVTAAAAKTANDAATKAVAASKPFTDALTALKAARKTQNTAAQTSAVATRESKLAAVLAPELKTSLAAAEARQKKARADVETATNAAAAAEQPIRAIAFSPDNRLLATGGDFSAVHSWDAETGKAIESFRGHEAPVLSLSFTGGGELISGSADKAALVWVVEPSWTLERTIGDIDDPSVLSDRVVALDFNTAGTRLVAGGGVPSRFGEFKVFNVADGSLVRSFADAHADEVFGVAFSPDGTRIASCGADKYVKAFDLATGKLVRSYEGHTDHVLGVAWRADGMVLASCGADNVIRVWNAETGDQLRMIAGFTKQVTSIRFIGESVNTVSGSGDKTVHLHRTDNGQNLRTFAGATDYVFTVSVTPDGRTVVAGGYDSVLRIWNGTNGQVLHSLTPPKPLEDIEAAKVAATPDANK
jgi:WD40 repeat protein